MSINSFNSLPSIKPNGASDALGGTKAATANTSPAPNGQEFSVYFERMMHPAFSAASSTQSANHSGSIAGSLKPLDSATSAFSSSLLDPNSSTLAFSHDYLKAKASVTDLQLNTPKSSASQAQDNLQNKAKTRETQSTSATKDRANRTTPGSNATAQRTHHSQSTIERLQKRVDSSQTPDQQPAQNAREDQTTASIKGQSSDSADNNPTKAVDADQKLAQASQALDGQRLPTATNLGSVDDLTSPINLDASSIDMANNLKTVVLSDNTQIITTNDAPNEKSLADFAKAMGFDEAQVAALFGPHAAQTMISSKEASPSTSLNVASSAQSGFNSSLAPAGAANKPFLALNAASPFQAGMNSTLTSAAGNASVLTHGDPSAATQANPLSKLPSVSINSALGAHDLHVSPTPIDASLQAAVSALPNQVAMGNMNAQMLTSKGRDGTMSSAENLAQLMSGEGVDPQSVQLNIATALKTGNAALNPAGNASLAPTSTLAVLNMTGSKLSEGAIAALQKEFNQLKGIDKGESSSSAFSVSLGLDSALPSSAQLHAGDAGNLAGGSGNGTSSGDTTAENAQATGTPVNMADTYEKLSEQLTAELSKRMHEQISQGQWKMKFALKPSTLGAVDVQLEMKDGKLAAVFQADNALTQNLLQHASQQLKDSLKDIGLNQTYVQVDQQNGGQAQQNGQENNARNPFEPSNAVESSANAQDSSPVVDASMKVKNNDSLLDLMA